MGDHPGAILTESFWKGRIYTPRVSMAHIHQWHIIRSSIFPTRTGHPRLLVCTVELESFRSKKIFYWKLTLGDIQIHYMICFWKKHSNRQPKKERTCRDGDLCNIQAQTSSSPRDFGQSHHSVSEYPTTCSTRLAGLHLLPAQVQLRPPHGKLPPNR